MSQVRRLGMLGVFALLFTVGQLAAAAEDGKDGIETVFVIAMENHNWTQPANQFSGGIGLRMQRRTRSSLHRLRLVRKP
jgi:hypothetical protein